MSTVGDNVVAADPAFARIVTAAGPFAPRDPVGDPFAALVRAIVFQQLAGRAALAIHGRVVALYDGVPRPEAILATPAEMLRTAGLSSAKIAAILDLALKCRDGTLPLDALTHLDDEDIVMRLSHVRGIGRWTAEMFLLFELRRPDVWPVGDLGVRKGYALIHDIAVPPSPQQLMALGEPFRPHRSAAAWYCWRAIDTVLP